MGRRVVKVTKAQVAVPVGYETMEHRRPQVRPGHFLIFALYSAAGYIRTSHPGRRRVWRITFLFCMLYFYFFYYYFMFCDVLSAKKELVVTSIDFSGSELAIE